MVNHYLLSNEELINQLINVIECSLEIDDCDSDDFDIDTDCDFNYKRNHEYWEIKKELLERMSK